MKSVGVAYVLWFFLGGLGIHKFYLGRTGWGIAYLLTGGILGIGWIIDLFTLPQQVRAANETTTGEAAVTTQTEQQETAKEKASETQESTSEEQNESQEEKPEK